MSLTVIFRETALRNLARIRGEDKDLFTRTRRAISALADQPYPESAVAWVPPGCTTGTTAVITGQCVRSHTPLVPPRARRLPGLGAGATFPPGAVHANRGASQPVVILATMPPCSTVLWPSPGQAMGAVRSQV